jgi:hypothetical protein
MMVGKIVMMVGEDVVVDPSHRGNPASGPLIPYGSCSRLIVSSCYRQSP